MVTQQASGTTRVAIFPSAGSVHLYHAVDTGIFASAGLDVDLHEVRSSDEQMALWDGGEVAFMHTAVDHLLRDRAGDPVAVRAEGIGELTVVAGADVDVRSARFAVDGVESAFSFVLQAIVSDRRGHALEREQLVPVGGTKQRFEALSAGEVDGTTLHAPFDAMADAAGFVSLGSHLDVLPDLITVVAVARRADVGSETLERYLGACADSCRSLLDGGADAIVTALERRGFPVQVAAGVAPQLLGPAGLARSPIIDRAGLEVSARLRSRYASGPSSAPPDLDRLLPDR